MDALEGNLEAMVITKPDRKTKQGKKQANRTWYLKNKAQKGKIQCKVPQGAWFNGVKAIKRGNDSKNVKSSTLENYNIKWNQNTHKYYWIGKMHYWRFVKNADHQLLDCLIVWIASKACPQVLQRLC